MVIQTSYKDLNVDVEAYSETGAANAVIFNETFQPKASTTKLLIDCCVTLLAGVMDSSVTNQDIFFRILVDNVVVASFYENMNIDPGNTILRVVNLRKMVPSPGVGNHTITVDVSTASAYVGVASVAGTEPQYYTTNLLIQEII